MTSDLIEARPGLAALVADEAGCDLLERLTVIHEVSKARGPADPTARAEAAFKRIWPGWK